MIVLYNLATYSTRYVLFLLPRIVGILPVIRDSYRPTDLNSHVTTDNLFHSDLNFFSIHTAIRYIMKTLYV